MDAARWQQVWEVFHEVAEEAPSSRAAALERLSGEDDELRREVESLLESFDQPTDFLDRPQVLSLEQEETASRGQRIGPYEVLGELGEGGMGAVYLARRADQEFERQVAIKLLRGGFEGQGAERRFRLERQILAGLDHPHIAKLLDGGSTEDRRPYLVLELIEGLPIDEYCRRQDLDLEARLRVFCLVCDAVDYAHRRLVVHRDLKPSNILVTEEGDPRLLDFGIAKLLSEDPRTTGTRIMTPTYASPEQIRGEPVHTASDVYALGVLLYELLAGRSPYRATTTEPLELAREILEDDPVPPSRSLLHAGSEGGDQQNTTRPVPADRRSSSRRWARRLEGDLDTIVLTALRKDPAERYTGASQLAADLRRHLDGHPIAARPDTVRYRIGKFVRRHRVGVAAAAAIVLLLVGATLLTSLLSLRLSRTLAEAQQERQKAESVAGFLTELFETSDPVTRLGEEVSTRDVLDRGAERIRTELAGQPEVQADLMMVMGVAYGNLGHVEPAMELFTASLDLRRRLFGADHPEVAASLQAVGVARRAEQKLQEAEGALREAVRILELDEANRAELAEAIDELGIVVFYDGRFEEAEEVQRRGLALRRAVGSDAQGTASSLNHLALALDRQAEYAEAETLFRESLEVGREGLERDHPSRAGRMMNLAGTLRKQGKVEEAETLFREVVEIRRRIYGERHPEVAVALHNLCGLLMDLGRDEEAEAAIRLALDITVEFQGPDHPETATRMGSLAILLERRGERREAIELKEQSLRINEARLGPNHPEVAIALHNLAQSRRFVRDFEAAVRDGRLAVERFEAAFGEEHPNTAIAVAQLGLSLSAAGDRESAEPLLRRALAIQAASHPPGHVDLAITRVQLANILRRLGHLEEAESLLLDALKTFDSGAGRPAQLENTLRYLSELYDSWGRPEQAEVYRDRLEAGAAADRG